MAEDQGVDGDLWNDHATKLLEKLCWKSIGDSNMDITTGKNTSNGVDRLLSYLEYKGAEKPEAVILEAKHYATTSFTPRALEEWIVRLDTKLSNIKTSSAFHEKFPDMYGIALRTGIIAIWFHDLSNFQAFKETFWKSVRNVRLNRKSALPNMIYILENDALLRLSSIVLAIESINSRDNKSKLKFYYPPVEGGSAKRSEVLNPNYMFSKFILAEYIDEKGIENKVVFYFGDLSIPSFLRLKDALSKFAYLDVDKPLAIFCYIRDDHNFRKIEPLVIEKYKEVALSFKKLNLLADFPSFE